MAKKSVWSKLKKAFRKAEKNSYKQSKAYESTQPSNQKATRNAYKKVVEEQQSKIKNAFKAEANNVKQRQQNAISNDYKTARVQQNAQANAAEKARKQAVDEAWEKAATKLAKKQGYDSLGQARKNGSAEMTALDIKFGQKKNDKLYSATKGLASGASAGLSDLSKKIVSPEIRKALEQAEKNQTKEGKTAETIGSLAGSILGIGGTAKASKVIGEKAIKGTGKVIGKDLSEEAVVKRLAPLMEKKAAKYSAKKGVEITGEDLARSMFKEYAEDIGMNIGGWGQVQAITEGIKAKQNGESGLKAYAKAQAGNALLGVPINNYIAGKEAVNGVKGAINKARVASKVDDILEPDTNLYLAKKGTTDVASETAKKQAKKQATKQATTASTEQVTKKGTTESTKKSAKEGVTPQANYEEFEKSYLEQRGLTKETLAEKTPKEQKEITDNLNKAYERFNGFVAKKSKGTKKADAPAAKNATSDANSNIPEWQKKAEKLKAELDASGKPRTKKSKGEKSLSEEAKNKAEFELSKGQEKMKSELSKADSGADYSKHEPLTYERAKEHKTLYRGHRGVREDGTQLSQTALTSIFHTDNEAQRKNLAEKIANSDTFLYEVKGHDENIKKAAERVARDPQAYISKAETIAKEGTSTKTMTDDSYDMYALLEYVGARLGKADLSNEEKATLEEINENCQAALKEMASPSGQTLELRGFFVKTNPESRTRLAVNDMCTILGKNRKFLKENNITATNKVDKQYQIEEVLMNNEEIDAALEKLYNAKGAEEIENAYSEALMSVNKLMKPSVYELMQEWRYLAMLGNPKTHIRNMIGNKLFGTVREASNTLAYVIEKRLKETGKLGDDYVLTKGALTKDAFVQARMKEPTDEIGKLAKAEYGKFYNATSKKDPKYEAVLLKNYPASTPVGKFVRSLSNFNSEMLEKADFSAMEKSFREAFYKAYKSNTADGKVLTESQLARIAENARDEALTSTFREFNSAANLLNTITRSTYDADASIGKKALGAVINAVLPFEKTPSNVLKQSIRYSPVGLVTGFAKINKAIKSGDAKAISQAIDDIASGTTGTGIAILGALFGLNSDIITTTAGNDAAGKFKKQNGVQDYSIRIGEYTFTLDWMTPIISTFFAGAELANELKNSSDKTGFDLTEDFGSFVSKILEPVLETSMLSGLNSAVEATMNNYSNSDDMAISRFLQNVAESYVSSFIPTLVGQASRTLYSADKQIVGDTDREYSLNSMRSKLGLANVGSNPLGDATDAYGNVKNKKEDVGDYLWSAAKNFIIPTNIQKVTLTDDDKKMIDIYNKAVASGMDAQQAASMFPKQSYVRQFVVGKKGSGQTEVTMTNKILSEYNQAKTNAGKEVFTALVGSKYFDGYSKAEKQELINSAPKTLQEAVGQIMKMPEFKNISAEEQSKLLARVINTGGDKAIGSIKEQELTAWKSLGKNETNYLFKNDLTERLQNNYKKYKDVVSKEDFLWFSQNALSENDTYTKASMTTALATRTDLSEKQKEALYNSFKVSNAKEYSGSSSGGSGSRSGGSSSTSSAQKIKTSAYKTKKFTPKSSSRTTSKGVALEVKSNLKESKATPPKLEEFKFKI